MAARKHMQLELFENIMKEISSVGIKEVCLTGGEPALHPDLRQIFTLFTEYETFFSLLSNGEIFEEKVLPILDSQARQCLSGICFSLDGATADTHDMIRGKGSYDKVISSMRACVKKNIPVSVKSIMHRGNMDEIADIAFICANLGVFNLGFIVLTPSPYLISKQLIPSPGEYMKLTRMIKGKILPSFSMKIDIEGYADPDFKASFCNPAHGISIDHLGNLIFCCNLSHPTAVDKPATLGKECLGNVGEIGIEECIIRHYKLLGWFMDKAIEAGLREGVRLNCVDCLQLFGKMDWIKAYETPYNRYH